MALALKSFGHFNILAQPVELFIAPSVHVGAARAIRPLFPRREAVVVGAFGLGHGMVFSLTLAEMNLSATRLALSLRELNLGIAICASRSGTPEVTSPSAGSPSAA
ncbi:HupE/UreJ family protein [Streptomyces sp. QTS52]